jgi:hypothetical protein
MDADKPRRAPRHADEAGPDVAYFMPSSDNPPPGPRDHFRMLVELRDAGVLTEDEFQAGKARLGSDI